MLTASLFFLAGNLLIQCLPQLPEPRLLLCVVGGLLLLMATLTAMRRVATAHRFTLQRRYIVALLFGLVWTWFTAYQALHRILPAELEGTDLWVSGTVSDLPSMEAYGQRFAFTLDAGAPFLTRRVLLTWYSARPQVHAGERWHLQVRLKHPHGFADPGGLDEEMRLLRQGIDATGYVRDQADNQRLGMVDGAVLLKARAALIERITKALPDHPMQGVVRGLALGDQQAISTQQWQVYARTGITHLLAISGFHIGMVAWACAWLGQSLLWWPRAQRWQITRPRLQAWFGITGAVGYACLAGMSVPTQRTLIMLVVYYLSRCGQQSFSVWQVYAMALSAVLLLDPFATLAVGTWLSFGSVAIILTNQHGRLARLPWWRELVQLQLMVSIGLVPMLLTAFGSVSLISPLVNLWAIPLFSAILAPAVLIGVALLVLHPMLGAMWLNAVAGLMTITQQALEWCARQPWALQHWPTLPSPLIALLLLATLMMLIPWHRRLRVTGALVCALTLLWRPPSLAAQQIRVTSLDVGQGLAVVVQTAQHVLLYDAGPRFQSGMDTGDLVVLPFLRAQGITRLDGIIASHGDSDHIGGIDSVMKSMSVHTLWRSPSVSLTALPRHASSDERDQRNQGDQFDQVCERGQHWLWDEVRFTVLWPEQSTPERNDNNQSCVLLIESALGRVLLLGDVERHVEQQLVQRGLPTVSLVIAPHHGSRSSSSIELVNATRPQQVVFSTGYRNRWRFPAPEVQQRWRAVGAELSDTAEQGAIIATLQSAMSVERYRFSHRHYWTAWPATAAETRRGPPSPD